jgi:hypothetical protein
VRVSIERHDVEDLDESEHLDATELEEAEDLEDVDDASGADDAVEEEQAAAVVEDDSDSEQASWEELLAQRAASKRASDDPDDVSEIMALSPQAREAVKERLAPKVSPVRDRQEFVCRRCHLVKPRTQLADEERGLCRDCA